MSTVLNRDLHKDLHKDGVFPGPSRLRPERESGLIGTDRPIAATPLEPRPREDTLTVALIDDRVLARECFAKSIEAARKEISIVCFSTVTEWQAAADRHPGVSIILLCHSGRRAAGGNRDVEILAKNADGTPVILMCDDEDAEVVHEAIELGARGFIPASVNLGVAVVAMHLVRAGGVYIPESILRSSRRLLRESGKESKQQIHGLFTERQAAVVEALRQGKPNKIIAYELNMRESTVKVHVRNVMKKLKAKNRTEIAFMTNSLFQHSAGQ